MLNTNERLGILYEEWYKDVFLHSLCNSEHCSNPLYLKAGDAWENKKVRLMYIGQEARGGWAKYLYQPDMISEIQEYNRAYLGAQLTEDRSQFNFARNQGAFWQFIREIIKENKEDTAVIWSNINKCCNSGKRSHLSELEQNSLHKLMSNGKTLIQNEIEILNPTHIIFVTGRYYGRSMNFETGLNLMDTPNINKLLVEFDLLGKRALWTYHPTSMRKNKYLRAAKETQGLIATMKNKIYS